MSLSVAEKRAATTAGSNRSIKTAGAMLEVAVAAISIVFLVMRPFIAQAFYIPSASMQPTLHEDDRIFVNKLSYRLGQPARHDVVVFHAPHEALAQDGASGSQLSEDTDFIKRIVGLPDDIIEIHHGVTYVNGLAQSEPYCREQPFYDMPPYVVPKDKLFVMGDNRNHSNDSHRWGALDKSMVVGRATCIFWPLSRAGAIR